MIPVLLQDYALWEDRVVNTVLAWVHRHVRPLAQDASQQALVDTIVHGLITGDFRPDAKAEPVLGQTTYVGWSKAGCYVIRYSGATLRLRGSREDIVRQLGCILPAYLRDPSLPPEVVPLFKAQADELGISLE